jgi:hypothetical protein
MGWQGKKKEAFIKISAPKTKRRGKQSIYLKAETQRVHGTSSGPELRVGDRHGLC